MPQNIGERPNGLRTKPTNTVYPQQPLRAEGNIMIAEYIQAHLHELSECRPIRIPLSNLIVTVDDFNHVANGMSLGAVLASAATTAQVVADLEILATAMWLIE